MIVHQDLFGRVKDQARGQWAEILPAVAGIPAELLDKRRHFPCPKCGGTDRFRFSDLDSDGSILCSQCGPKIGDGISTVAWMLGCSQLEAAKKVADFLGIDHSNGQAQQLDPLEAVARLKKLRPEDLAAYGAAVEQGAVVFPAFDHEGNQCTDFRIWPSGSDKQKKGLFAKGKPAGVFLPVADGSPRLPQAGESWCIVEGVKDAAALHRMGWPTLGMNTSNLASKFAGLLRGVAVTIIPDRDHAGDKGAEQTARRLYRVAESIRIAALPIEWTESDGADVRDVLGKPNGEQLVRDAIEQAQEWKPTPTDQGDGQPLEAVDDPHRLARLHLTELGTTEGVESLWYWRDDWHRWDGATYRTVPEQEIRAEVVRIAKREFDADNLAKLAEFSGKGEPPTCRKVTTALVTNVLAAMQSERMLSSRQDQPVWLCESEFPAGEILATANSLVHLPSLIRGEPCKLRPTPLYFSHNLLPFDFDPAATCPQWEAFLASLWPDDPESIAALQQWFGYALTTDTSQHRFLMVVGPPRSGKGTIARVLRRMIGEANIACPTLASLAGPFGLQPLVGKTMAVIADARLSGRADAVAVVERLLSISGEDPQDVHRKHQSTLAGIRLPVRFMVLTNELPSMKDVSGALMTRVLMLVLSESFVGREDRGLFERLTTEMPGILNWSIRGWERLRARGHFTQPTSGQDLIDELAELSSPIKAFIADCCHVGPEWSVSIPELFSAWVDWCKAHGRDRTGTEQTFGRDVRTALPRLRTGRPRLRTGSPRRDGERVRIYRGIGLKNGFGPQWSA